MPTLLQKTIGYKKPKIPTSPITNNEYKRSLS